MNPQPSASLSRPVSGAHSTLGALPHMSHNYSFSPNMTIVEKEVAGAVFVAVPRPLPTTDLVEPAPSGQCTSLGTMSKPHPGCGSSEAVTLLPPRGSTTSAAVPDGGSRAPLLGPGVGCGLCLYSHGGCFLSGAGPGGPCMQRQGCVSSG